MVTIEEAQRIILRHIAPLPAEELPLLQGLGRVASEDVIAPRDIPATDNSAMDGYAFSFAAIRGNSLFVSGNIPAGKERVTPVAAGEAVRIMTGAPIPRGCDTVVPIEDVETAGDTIRLAGDARPGAHIRKRGEDLRAGERAIAAGSRLRPQEIGMLASLGKTSVRVHRRPKVGILATGDELLEIGSLPSAGKIIDSNSWSIAGQVMESGGDPVILGIAGDEVAATCDRIREGIRGELLITTGGVSVGDRDCVKEAVSALGGEIRFWKVHMKPGKPVAFGILSGKPVFALPGNPAAAMISFEVFVRPALLKMTGHKRLFRPTVTAALTGAIANKGERPHLIRVWVEARRDGYVASPTGNQSSARLSSLTAANGFTMVAPGTTLSSGESVVVSLLDWPEALP
ncbi:MAG: gephyrin-like molybdotransferase Glp [Actinomycetota bacterium]